MNRIEKIQFRAIQRPLRTLFSTSLGQKSVMKSVIVKVTLDDGRSTVGEVPTSFVLKHETVPTIKEILAKESPRFLGMPIQEYSPLIPPMRKAYLDNPMTIAGLETALFRAALVSRNIAEHEYWGGRLKRLETDITLPFLTDLEGLERWVRYVLKKRFHTYKLKVSGDIEADERIISFVYRFLSDNLESFALRIDGNQGYSVKSFLRMVDRITKKRFQIELVEQPLPKHDYDGFKRIRGRCPMPILVDEMVFSSEDLQRVIDGNLADGVNIKFAKSGVAESATMIRMAKKHKMKLMIGCMTETMVGLSAGILCAAGSGSFDYIDLDGVFFLYHRNQYEQIHIEGPEFVI